MMCRVVRVFGLIGSGQNKKVFVMSETFSQFLAGCSTKLYSWGLKRFAFWIIKKAYMSIGVSEIYRVTSEIALKELFQKDEIALAQNRDTILTEYAEYLFLPVVSPVVKPDRYQHHRDDESNYEEIQRTRPRQNIIFRCRKREPAQHPLEDADMDGKIHQHHRYA